MNQNAEVLKNAISGSLNIIEQDREREIISRRFGLNGNRETLEQIGEMLSITRERVRQLEKAILIHLQISAEENQIPEKYNILDSLLNHQRYYTFGKGFKCFRRRRNYWKKNIYKCPKIY